MSTLIEHRLSVVEKKLERIETIAKCHHCFCRQNRWLCYSKSHYPKLCCYCGVLKKYHHKCDVQYGGPYD